MPIVYDKKTKKWDLRIKEGDKEELQAVLAVGRKVILGELSGSFTAKVQQRWLEMPEEMMFHA